MDRDVEIKVVHVPMLDTGLGREAGYANDAELVEAANKQRAEMFALMTSEAVERFKASEREVERRLLGF
jgi:hypothetical protein